MLVETYSVLLGYLTAKVFCGPHEHQRGVLRSIIMHYRSLEIHVHHWIMAFLLASVYLFFKLTILDADLTPADLAATYFLIGIIIQGIADYRDWKEIIVSEA